MVLLLSFLKLHLHTGLLPIALITSLIYSYLFFNKFRLYSKIKNNIIKRILKIFTYGLIILVLTIFMTVISFYILIGIIILYILNTIGLILLIKKIKTIKSKAIKIIIKIIAYVLLVIHIYILWKASYSFFGLTGVIVFFILCIIGISFFIKRLIILTKNKRIKNKNLDINK